MASTQEFLSIREIKNDLVILKDGSMAVVLCTSAVNFGLLSENEQIAIIDSFANFLNSLSFAIQIIIKSEWLDITTYLNYLNKAKVKQTNPLLIKMIDHYRVFIERTVKENRVLDKQFYIVIPISFLELGILKDIEGHMKKALTIIIPRRDHILRQLSRMGLKARQLTTEQLIKLFYSSYNRAYQEETKKEVVQQNSQVQPEITQVSPPQPTPTQPKSVPIQPPQPVTINPLPSKVSSQPSSSNLVTPFVVEELTDEYTAV